MQKLLFLAFFITPGLILTSCSKEKVDDLKKGPSFVDFSIVGASFNGVYNITHDLEKDSTELKATALVTPASGDSPELVFLTYQDNIQKLTVGFIMPAEEGVVVPPLGWQPANGVENHFSMHITHTTEEIVLVSTNVNLTITEYEVHHDPIFVFGVPYIEGSFEGEMIYKNEDNQEEIHIVTGDFKYSIL